MSQITKSWGGWAARGVALDRRFRIAAGMAAFVVATSAGAYVAVPLPWTPVPTTLQPLFVILAGAVLGARAGAAAMVTYVALGAAGAPVFSAGHSGIAWLLGPTGGYLLAFPAAAFLVGILAGPRSSGAGRTRLLLALAAGIAALYVGGVAQLLLLTKQDLGTLLAQGVTPFIGGDALKIFIAFLLASSFRSSRLGRG